MIMKTFTSHSSAINFRVFMSLMFQVAFLEVCVDSVRSALNAFGGGASRIELCSALCLGGLTPSMALFKVTRNLLPSSCKIFVMIRPRPGDDYVYGDHEIKVMMEDVQLFRENGADGFVFGCLNTDKSIDEKACKKLLETAGGLPCTFHRAFDVAKKPEDSVVSIASMGFARLLTSGQKENAHLGMNLIKKLVDTVEKFNLELIIVAGGGIDLDNLTDILNGTRVKEFHGTAKARSHKQFDKKKLSWETDESVVREMVRIAKNQ